jgi:hypothetical protein
VRRDISAEPDVFIPSSASDPIWNSQRSNLLGRSEAK